MTARILPIPSIRTVPMRAVHHKCRARWMQAASAAIASALLAIGCAYFDLMLAAWLLLCLSAAFSGASTCAAVIGKDYAP